MNGYTATHVYNMCSELGTLCQWRARYGVYLQAMLSRRDSLKVTLYPLLGRVSPPLSSVQSLSCVVLFANPWTAARQSPSITSSQSLLKLMPIASVIASNHLILCGPLLLLPSIFPSIRVFSNESVLRIRCPQFWSFSISPSNEYSGLISFRMDWFDLLAVQGTLKSLLQHHSSKASVLPPQSYSF